MKVFDTRHQMKLAVCAAVVSICGMGIQAVRADYDFIGGNSANNANGTETNFFASDGWVNTGASPAYAVGGPPPSGTDPAGGTTSPTINFNTGVTDTGAIFDPVNQNPSATLFATNGKVYIDSNNSGPGSTSGTTYSQTYPNNPYTTVQPNYLEIDSGEFHINGTGSASILIVGRSGPGTLIINGGNLTNDNVIQVGGDSSNVAQTGTITYESGVLSSGFGSSPGSSPGIRLGNGLGCTGNFVDYNDGPGNITVSGFYVSYEAGGTGSTGNVTFHYDNGGVMPIQVHNSTANAQLSIRNSATQSSRLSLDLDSSPTMTLVSGVEVPQNLGLFSDDEITGISGDSKDFFDPTGATDLAEGTAITERAPNGYTDTWDISYQGKINFSNTATSAISSITGPNNLLGDSTTGGTDVVLMGVSAIAPVIGDANGDGIVNTLDEAILQQNLGKSVTGGYAAADFNDDGIVNADDLAIFQYGVALYDSSHPTSAPEPAALAVLAAFPLLAARRRR